jgi:hypothetical protein
MVMNKEYVEIREEEFYAMINLVVRPEENH